MIRPLFPSDSSIHSLRLMKYELQNAGSLESLCFKWSSLYSSPFFGLKCPSRSLSENRIALHSLPVFFLLILTFQITIVVVHASPCFVYLNCCRLRCQLRALYQLFVSENELLRRRKWSRYQERRRVLSLLFTHHLLLKRCLRGH